MASPYGDLIDNRAENAIYRPQPGEPEPDDPNWWNFHRERGNIVNLPLDPNKPGEMVLLGGQADITDFSPAAVADRFLKEQEDDRPRPRTAMEKQEPAPPDREPPPPIDIGEANPTIPAAEPDVTDDDINSLLGLDENEPAEPTRVFGNAPAGPLPQGQWGRPQQAGPLGGQVRPYGPGAGQYGGARRMPGQQGGEPPGMDREPWLPHGEFQATPAQRQLAAVYRKGGPIAQDVYHQALRDKQAQEEGLSRDWRPSMAQVEYLQQVAEYSYPLGTPHRAEKVGALVAHLVGNYSTQNFQAIKQEQTNKEHRVQEDARMNRLEAREDRRDERTAQATRDKLEFEGKREENRIAGENRKAEAAATALATKNATAKKTAHIDAGVKHEQDQRKYWRTELGKKTKGITDDAERAKAESGIEDQARQKAEADAVEYGATTEQGRELQGILRSAPQKNGQPDFERMTPQQLDAIKEAMDQDPVHFGVRRAIGREWSVQLDALAKKRGTAIAAERKGEAAKTVGVAAGPAGAALTAGGVKSAAEPAATPPKPAGKKFPDPPAPKSDFLDNLADALLHM